VPKTPELRAAKGARWLDKNRPGWADKITRPVNVASSTDCVWGQLEGSYSRRPKAFNGVFSYLTAREERFGFYSPYRYERGLNDAWADEIDTRRSVVTGPAA
jgi:hypothetical protein